MNEYATAQAPEAEKKESGKRRATKTATLTIAVGKDAVEEMGMLLKLKARQAGEQTAQTVEEYVAEVFTKAHAALQDEAFPKKKG